MLLVSVSAHDTLPTLINLNFWRVSYIRPTQRNGKTASLASNIFICYGGRCLYQRSLCVEGCYFCVLGSPQIVGIVAKHKTKTLTTLLGTINPSHLKNAGELLNKIRNTNWENKLIANLDIQSIYPLKNISSN